MNTLMKMSHVSPHTSKPVSLYPEEVLFLTALIFSPVTLKKHRSKTDEPQGVFTSYLCRCYKSMPTGVSSNSEEL